MRVPEAWRVDARRTGGALCVAGLALVWLPSLWATALGVELLAVAFWWWARAAEDRDDQLPRWVWLRRPAATLWLAAAAGEVLRQAAALGDVPLPIVRILLGAQAVGVVWAGLELLAALPLARPFSDRPGPLLALGPWLPVLLPSTGFVILWRQVAHWTAVPTVRQAALLLLLVTVVLAALRAFSRRRWLASLRWLIVADCALASALVALSVVPMEVSLLLWLAACGGRSALLAGELRGMEPRRVSASLVLWRLSGWTATTALSWTVLVALAFGPPGIASPPFAAAASFGVAMTAWVVIRRMVEAPERRAMVRRESAVSLSRLAGALTLALGPVALALAWWAGFEAPWPAAWVAAMPAAAPGLVAWWLEGTSLRVRVPPWLRGGTAARGAAHGAFRLIVGLERRVVDLLARAGRGLLAAGRDLHTGDAQEYLLFLIGVSVLALVVPLLR